MTCCKMCKEKVDKLESEIEDLKNKTNMHYAMISIHTKRIDNGVRIMRRIMDYVGIQWREVTTNPTKFQRICRWLPHKIRTWGKDKK
ncbi:MAG: hypothetical protein GY861_17055 [bacterium]|nr:hypothetical protein [bacterium]